MLKRLQVLASTISAIEVPFSVVSFHDRKLLQKAVYLAQEIGVHLGYNYSWNQCGPFSAKLAEDYYELADLNIAGLIDLRSSNTAVESAVRSRKPLFTFVPDRVALSRSDWLELLASVHFLISKADQDSRHAKAIIKKEKPALSNFYAEAKATLEAASLLTA